MQCICVTFCVLVPDSGNFRLLKTQLWTPTILTCMIYSVVIKIKCTSQLDISEIQDQSLTIYVIRTVSCSSACSTGRNASAIA